MILKIFYNNDYIKQFKSICKLKILLFLCYKMVVARVFINLMYILLYTNSCSNNLLIKKKIQLFLFKYV